MPKKPGKPAAKAPAKRVAKVTGKATPVKAQPKRRNTDWDAVERDFRTGKFTLRELGNKYDLSHAVIGKRSRDHQWPQDLAEKIRQETDALLVADLVSKDAAESIQQVSKTVQIAAELNKQVILGHRTDLKSTRDVAADLLQELAAAALLAQEQELLTQIIAGDGATPAQEINARQLVTRALSVNSRISSVKALAETFAKLQESERKAFSIDAAKPETVNDPMAEFMAALSARGSRLPTKGGAA